MFERTAIVSSAYRSNFAWCTLPEKNGSTGEQQIMGRSWLPAIMSSDYNLRLKPFVHLQFSLFFLISFFQPLLFHIIAVEERCVYRSMKEFFF